MSKTKDKLQKRKDREREVRKKVLTRREKLQKGVKESRKLDLEEEAARAKKVPINNETYYKIQQIHDAEIKLQLQHNMEILDHLKTHMGEEEFNSATTKVFETIEKNISKKH